MKKVISLLIVMFILLSIGSTALCSEYNFYTDEELLTAYDEILAELERRGLIETATQKLEGGKYVIGKDIPAGEYTIECLKTEDDDMKGMIDAYSGLFSAIPDDEAAAYGNFVGAIGGMMDTISDGASIRILGDFGTVLKEYHLKTGEKMSIVLEDGTALEVSEGVCEIRTK